MRIQKVSRRKYFLSFHLGYPRLLHASNEALDHISCEADKRVFSFLVSDQKEIHETIDKIVAQNFNAIEENFEIKRMFKEMFKSAESSPIYQLKKHYPEVYAKALTSQIEVCETCFRNNILKGMNEGLYRENLDVDNYIKFYYTLIFNINENTASVIEAEELELKALEYHIRAMATLAGIIELEKHLKNPII